MKYDIKAMYYQGHCFQLAAERCMEERINDQIIWLPIQATVCYAMACEIYLKALYLWENPAIEKMLASSRNNHFGINRNRQS